MEELKDTGEDEEGINKIFKKIKEEMTKKVSFHYHPLTDLLYVFVYILH